MPADEAIAAIEARVKEQGARIEALEAVIRIMIELARLPDEDASRPYHRRALGMMAFELGMSGRR